MKENIIAFGKWAQDNWLALIIMMGAVMMIFLCLVMISWIYGYWSNALYGTKFDLASCWAGVSVVVTGLGGMVGLGKAAWTKYGMDSRWNSNLGCPPPPMKGEEEHARRN